VTHFLYMGGYARFLWPSYGVTFAVVFLNVIWARRLLSRSQAEARRRILSQESSP